MKCAACGYDADAPVSLRIEFTIALDSKSDNGRGVNAGASRWAYKKNREQWAWHIRAAMMALPPAQLRPADKRRRLTITRRFGGTQRMRDHDNVVTSFKPVVDELVKAGLLTSDNAKGVDGPYYSQEHVTTGVGVHFLIEELA